MARRNLNRLCLGASVVLLFSSCLVNADETTGNSNNNNNNTTSGSVFEQPDSYIDDLNHCENPFTNESLPISCDPFTWLWNLDELQEQAPPALCQSLSASEWRFVTNRNIMPNEWEPCRHWYREFYKKADYAGDFVIATVAPTAAPGGGETTEGENEQGKYITPMKILHVKTL